MNMHYLFSFVSWSGVEAGTELVGSGTWPDLLCQLKREVHSTISPRDSAGIAQGNVNRRLLLLETSSVLIQEVGQAGD